MYSITRHPLVTWWISIYFKAISELFHTVKVKASHALHSVSAKEWKGQDYCKINEEDSHAALNERFLDDERLSIPCCSI